MTGAGKEELIIEGWPYEGRCCSGECCETAGGEGEAYAEENTTGEGCGCGGGVGEGTGAESAAKMSSAAEAVATFDADTGRGPGGGATASSLACVMSDEKEVLSVVPKGSEPLVMWPSERGGGCEGVITGGRVAGVPVEME